MTEIPPRTKLRTVTLRGKLVHFREVRLVRISPNAESPIIERRS